jgi:TrmH family RNA methyltransferase
MNKNGFEYVTSKQNEKIKLFAKLGMSKYRNETKLFLAEGVKLAEESVDSDSARFMLACESCADDSAIKRILDKCGESVIKYILSDPVFEKVSTESAPQGIIAVSAVPYSHKTDREVSPTALAGKRVAAFDSIRDPGNLGTILRSALAFGFDAVILYDCADIYNPKAVRASMGAVFKMRVVTCGDLPSYLSGLKDLGRRVLGAALRDDAEDFSKVDLKTSDVPVIGNEGHGIGDDVASSCSSFIKIPMTDRAESLNAAVASSVIMWEYSKLR